jgi:hypothetical protein
LGIMIRTLAPMLVIFSRMDVEEPAPICIMVMTALTPITMPSVVNRARKRFRFRALTAMRRVVTEFMAYVYQPLFKTERRAGISRCLRQ